MIESNVLTHSPPLLQIEYLQSHWSIYKEDILARVLQLFQKLSCTEYENAEDDYWVSDIKGFTEYTYELVDSDDNVIDSA